MQSIVEEPKPIAPPRPPEPAKPVPVAPLEGQPPSNKRPVFIAGGAVVLILLVVAVIFIINRSGKQPTVAPKPEVTAPTQNAQPTKASVRIIGLPQGATFRLGEHSGTADHDGTARVETDPGTYPIEVDAPNYDHYSGSVTLLAGENESITPPMNPTAVGKVGILIAKANVDHFDVFIDGRLRVNSGKAQQARIPNLPEGSHKVLIRKSDYEDPQSQNITISASKEQPASFILKTKPPTDATLSLQVRPANAAVRVDGQPVLISNGSYSGKLSIGQHNVEASADGYQTQSKSVTAKAGDPLPLSLELQPVPATPKPQPQPTITANAVPNDIEQGKSATIHWSTQNASQVVFEGSPFEANGHIDVTPNTDTTYTLTAKGLGGEKTEHVTVKVHAKAVTITEKPTTVDEKPAILAAVQRWQSAYERLDIDGLKLIYPQLPAVWIRRIQDLKDHKSKIKVTYNCTDVKYSVEAGQTKCIQLVAVEGQGDRPRPTTAEFELKKQGENWIISGISVAR